MNHRGWIALDIDGTITEDKYSIPEPVVTYLKQLSDEGWLIAFATGRSYAFASIALSVLNFPYYFLPQNGSIVLKMPEKQIVEKKYIPFKDLQLAERLTSDLGLDCLVYKGFEKGDSGFYRRGLFAGAQLTYIEDLQTREREAWTPIDSFSQIDQDSFPILKYFGTVSEMEKVETKLKDHFVIAKINDPFSDGGLLLLVTDHSVSKGLSLNRLIEKEGRGAKVLAAGNDMNDLSLLEVADIAIVMPGSPAELLALADIIAPPITSFGIISALTEAIAR
jgi:HAD superfamily hydrolase (TIGR01484 family)